jgi:hypothetical protein
VAVWAFLSGWLNFLMEKKKYQWVWMRAMNKDNRDIVKKHIFFHIDLLLISFFIFFYPIKLLYKYCSYFLIFLILEFWTYSTREHNVMQASGSIFFFSVSFISSLSFHYSFLLLLFVHTPSHLSLWPYQCVFQFNFQIFW